MNNNQLNVIMWIAGIVVIVWGMVQYFGNIDNKVMERGIAYDQCVIDLYNVTPSEYLSMKGVMPECE